MHASQTTIRSALGRRFTEIVSPKPIRPWSHYDFVLENEDEAFINGSLCDPQHFPNTSLVREQRRKENWYRDWHNYRAVLRAAPESTIAPPWPPFVAPPEAPSPSPSPSPMLSFGVPVRRPRELRAPEYQYTPGPLTQNMAIGTRLPSLIVGSGRRVSISLAGPEQEPRSAFDVDDDYSDEADDERSLDSDREEGSALRSSFSDSSSSAASPDLVVETPPDDETQMNDLLIRAIMGFFDGRSDASGPEMIKDIPERSLSVDSEDARMYTDPLTDDEVYDERFAHSILQRAAAARELEHAMAVLSTG